jgi:hypothetical protein
MSRKTLKKKGKEEPEEEKRGSDGQTNFFSGSMSATHEDI